MKAKRTAQPRRRISFAVDRDEIEINSDWVDAVMATPAPASPPTPPPSTVVSFPAPRKEETDLFFAPEQNTATDEQSTTGEKGATGAECTSVENSSAVDKVAPVAESSAVEVRPPVENKATVAQFATVGVERPQNERVSGLRPSLDQPLAVENNATVEHNSSGEERSTGESSASTKDHRVPRPRTIVRVTDGLTPGQYAVYSLMYESGEGTGGSTRIYKGGYADLGRLTGLSKRGIQNIVAELQAKEVIRIHQQPGYHRTETSAYLVPDPEAVVQLWFEKGWRRALGKSKALIS